ncbi:hypothetical protein AGABI2DRAFT_117215 [Agaricus bisporus var. bisporus H97]|uniref:hypothetical protein n=1 Tax=Agaricus bisporus var. bisporus (strain H97 / ATCC MYA-4626 / FGSC 10389) TaxID=936046 RepID=UPI00029F6B4C|nr:hypothetical protein AGABI2DRAFT_117215 [Agaricus bisporus var. bisporus H97]EKV48392.1 hypothetical protein AGABI2DRAFT_117215 [Agaricus bisporus var. bisporus H97]
MQKEGEEDVKATRRQKRRGTLSLADLHPSPLAGHLWGIITKVTLMLEPWLRPLMRNAVVGCFRIIIKWLPALTQALSFELHSTVFTLAQIPRTQVVADEINLHAELVLTPVENLAAVTGNNGRSTEVSPSSSWTFYGMSTWKKKMSDGLKRALDRAWGTMRGSASISFKLSDVVGTTPKEGQSGHENSRIFLRLPGSLMLDGKLKFFPQTATIDANSVTVGLKADDIIVGVDLLNEILRVVLPTVVKRPKNPIFAPDVPSRTLPQSSEKSELPTVPARTPAARHSRSPTLFSAGFLPLELSPKLPRASPLFKAFSSSLYPRDRSFPSYKLRDCQYKSALSSIKKVSLHVSSVSLLFSSTTSRVIDYKTLVNDVRADFHPSSAAKDSLHSRWLGSAPRREAFDAEAYCLRFRITTVMLERHKKGDVFPIATLGSLDFQTVLYQWPAPLLMPSLFMRGDPNAPFLASSLTIGGIDLADRLEDLCDFLERRVSKTGTKSPKKDFSNIVDGFQLPRSSIQVHCGVICVRLIQNGAQETSSSLEMRTDGFTFKLNANYDSDQTIASTQTLPPNFSCFSGRLALSLHPVLLHVRSGWCSVGFASDNEFLNDPAILSMGPVEIDGSVRAEVEEELDIFRVKRASLSYDVHTIVDTFAIELWHADSVSAAAELLAQLPTASVPASDSTLIAPSKPLSLPPGVVSIVLARFIVVVTSPDINPKDVDLSRGIGLKTMVSLELVNPAQSPRVQDEKLLKLRRSLGLTHKRLEDTIAASKGNVLHDNTSALLRLKIANLLLRKAFATQFETDDPFLAGRDDLTPTDQEFMRIPSVQLDVSIMGGDDRHTTRQVTVTIPSIQGKFELSNVYCSLLAAQTLQAVARTRQLVRPDAANSSSTSIKWSVDCRVQSFNLQWALPNQTLVSLLEDARFSWLSNQSTRFEFKSLAFWVPTPILVHGWEYDHSQKWDQLLTFYLWNISFPMVNHSLSIDAVGQSLRLRIPHGYVLADLILDLIVVAKAAKHLVHIVKSGVFSDIPSPEPEAPKISPNISFEIQTLCVEAADDPFEAKLSAIWRVGLDAVKQRLEREEAFSAKVAAIQAGGDNSDTKVVAEGEHDYQFTAKHTVPLDDARRRLDEVHFLDWKFRLQNLREARSNHEISILHKLYGPQGTTGRAPFPKSKVSTNGMGIPPLFRVYISSLKLSVSLPTFPLEELPNFLYDQGGGLPIGTEFSLLVPLHIRFTLNTIRITARDFPIPLVHVQDSRDSILPACVFDSDVVIAEEMGSDASSDWMDCPVLPANQGIYGTGALTLHVPKTIMPVKSYACPAIEISTACPTVLSWGVSYMSTLQDVVRVIESLSPNPRDPSPPIGFWDKLRLIAHWKIKFSFKEEVRVYLKGSRDPVKIADDGAGFVLVWKGSPQLLIGYPNVQGDLLQLTSDTSLIAVPKFGEITSDGTLNLTHLTMNSHRKICAELHSGVRWGIGFVFERTCDAQCGKCSGHVFQRQCRLFDFVPHYAVRLESKSSLPTLKGIDDSYKEFRSDFIHFSFSLTASTKEGCATTNALHLTPKAFTHFWAWWSLFDSVPTLRIRVGAYFTPRPVTPKFGRHIATIKYRIVLSKLFVMHGYLDDSPETWANGVTSWIGVKGMVDEVRIDMHQREQETQVRGIEPNTTKTAHRKPFYAAETVLQGVDLRTVFAIFADPLKAEISTNQHFSTPNTYLQYNDLPQTSTTSSWYDTNDFIELDWESSSEPTLHYLPLLSCPRFTYLKRNTAEAGGDQDSKFGIENTHHCLLGQESSAPQIQINLAAARIDELRRYSTEDSAERTSGSRKRMIKLLQDYMDFLKNAETDDVLEPLQAKSYHLPSEVVLPEEWTEFDNTYQLHCPKLSLEKATRDIMIQYYECSRARKGFEYHLATRAVKYIRDQAKASKVGAEPENKGGDSISNKPAQLAASAIRKLLKGDVGKSSVEMDQQDALGLLCEPLDGWCAGVTLYKAHCCFLLKPQVVLRDEDSGDICVVAATQAKLQSFAIMDDANIDDPISGKIMSRNYTSLSGFQIFCPNHAAVSSTRLQVPLEVLIDRRCESDEFERLVPQTDATFHYDKFNRLRLRNEVTSVVGPSLDTTPSISRTHLQDQTDLIRMHIPHLTVSADDKHFRTISNIVTKLLLFSDAAHKERLDKLETLLFSYDFMDLRQAADVITDLQSRLRAALETERVLEHTPRHLPAEEFTKLGRLRLRSHILALTEELDYLFGAIKLVQDRTDERMDQKSALLVHASSSEMSWKMLGDDKDLLAKLVIEHSNFYWLSRQDSAMVNDLVIGNLQAFDGSREAIWTEILLKDDEPANHPLHKRNLFLSAHWSILPPVGGISIYETFEVSLHPLKLQIDAKLGRRIMEYLWPDRRDRQRDSEDELASTWSHDTTHSEEFSVPKLPIRSSIDSPRGLQNLQSEDVSQNGRLAPPSLRRLGSSRSFTDLRYTFGEYDRPQFLLSNGGSNGRPDSSDVHESFAAGAKFDATLELEEKTGDAAVMKTRSSQKTFIHVKVASMNLVLSILKEGSFECHDVRIKTRDLIYQNQTSSFEELVNKFIPSNMSWKGWMKMVFHQPLIPVFPVARQILSKTKLVGSSRVIQSTEVDGSLTSRRTEKKRTLTLRLPGKHWGRSIPTKLKKKPTNPTVVVPDVPIYTSQPLSAEPEPLKANEMEVIETSQETNLETLKKPSSPS